MRELSLNGTAWYSGGKKGSKTRIDWQEDIAALRNGKPKKEMRINDLE
jgi:hypothetical protein